MLSSSELFCVQVKSYEDLKSELLLKLNSHKPKIIVKAKNTSVDVPTCDDAPVEDSCGDAPVEDSCDGAPVEASMATSQSAQASEMGSSANQAPNWEDVKKKILAAIKKDEEAQVF